MRPLNLRLRAKQVRVFVLSVAIVASFIWLTSASAAKQGAIPEALKAEEREMVRVHLQLDATR
jgi:hypothetical protein